MKPNHVFVSLVLCLTIFSCDTKEIAREPSFENDGELTGTWGVFESGYSPGAGYIVEPVPSSPLQYLSFKPNGNAFQSNFHGLENFKFYLIIDDPDSEEDILALYHQLPEHPENEEIMNLQHSYIIHPVEDGKVELWYRFCIEGCHIGINKVVAID